MVPSKDQSQDDLATEGQLGLESDDQPHINCVAGYQDITPVEFAEHYQQDIDDAIERGDTFLVTDELGVGEMALSYLLSEGVVAGRITIYRRGSTSTESTANQIVQQYRDCFVKFIAGGDCERMRAMINESEDDIIWLRPCDGLPRMSASDVLSASFSGTKELKRLSIAKGIDAFMEEYDGLV